MKHFLSSKSIAKKDCMYMFFHFNLRIFLTTNIRMLIISNFDFHWAIMKTFSVVY
jgi:hypothetical protein